MEMEFTHIKKKKSERGGEGPSRIKKISWGKRKH